MIVNQARLFAVLVACNVVIQSSISPVVALLQSRAVPRQTALVKASFVTKLTLLRDDNDSSLTRSSYNHQLNAFGVSFVDSSSVSYGRRADVIATTFRSRWSAVLAMVVLASNATSLMAALKGFLCQYSCYMTTRPLITKC